MSNAATTYYRDPQGRQVIVVEVPSRRQPSNLYVEVVDGGTVVDHFTLTGPSALAATAVRRKWKEQT